ncbi:MAG: thioredoxin domain-containing protein [Gemmatimonadetes bacterium]|nr:thioredoxin domain-containing protein [Gemmatimonadota bacterium]
MTTTSHESRLVELGRRLNTFISIAVILFAAYYFLRSEGPLGRQWVQYQHERNVTALARSEWHSLSQRPILGSGDADVVVFTDYECPFCRAANDTIDRVLKLNPTVAIAHRQFPLTAIHANARAAAVLVECADEQGFFEPVHRSLMTTNEWQSTGDFDALINATEGLDVDQFDVCRDSADIAVRLRRDSILARNLAVTATPTFVSRHGIHVGVPTQETLLNLAGARP